MAAASLVQVDLSPKTKSLDEVTEYPHLNKPVHNLRKEAETLVPAFRYKGKLRRVLMVNSTSQGGGVAEMMPRVVQVFRDIGLETMWYVMTPTENYMEPFFEFTKKMHNLIHGCGDAHISEEEKKLYETVTTSAGQEMLDNIVQEGDIVILHDPQPLGMAKVLCSEEAKKKKLVVVFRSHIGLDVVTPETDVAWKFLVPMCEMTDGVVFSTPEYIHGSLTRPATVIPPGLDPLSHKNRELVPTKLIGVMCNAGLMEERHPVLTAPWPERAQRLQPDGTWAPACPMDGHDVDDLGLLYRPIVTQVSRWDELKGWLPLMKAFALLKTRRKEFRDAVVDSGSFHDRRHIRRLELCRLVMAGPDPSSIADDPEGKEVLREICEEYTKLEPEVQSHIALLSLPMKSRKRNALMVNALQRCSDVVVQNSHREGFGLTVTEAMLKGVPVLGTQACGLRQQLVDGVHGRLVLNSYDSEEIATTLNEMMKDDKQRAEQGLRAQRRVLSEFTTFAQVSKWITFLHRLVTPVDYPQVMLHEHEHAAAKAAAKAHA